MAQNNELIKENIMLNTQLKILDERMEKMEIMLNADVDLKDFSIETIDSEAGLVAFSQKLQNDQLYYNKCVCIPQINSNFPDYSTPLLI